MFRISKKDHPYFKVEWFKTWHRDLDTALDKLPEMDGCPHELYRLLTQNSITSKKRIVLVTRKGEPVGLVGLRRRRRDWVPVTHYLLPGAVFPVSAKYWQEVLEVLGVDLWIGWWRMNSQPPASRLIRSFERIPTYKIDLSEDYEKQWDKKFRKSVNRYRRRCGDFSCDVNAPGAADWTIRNWKKKWYERSEGGRDDLDDRLLVADYMERIGRHFTLILRDKNKPICGVTAISHANELVGQYSYRIPEYDSFGIGKYVKDVLFKWAAGNGFSKIDLGGDYAGNKRHWGVRDGEKITFNICPKNLYRLKNLMKNFDRIRTRGVSTSDIRRLFSRSA